jgi:hypothetical protein
MFGSRSTVQLALIIESDSFCGTNGIIFSFTITRGSACIMGTLQLMDTMHEAKILKVNIRVPGANRMPFIRAVTNLIFENCSIIILDPTDSIIGQVNGLEHPSTVISICDSIYSTNWFELT